MCSGEWEGLQRLFLRSPTCVGLIADLDSLSELEPELAEDWALDIDLDLDLFLLWCVFFFFLCFALCERFLRCPGDRIRSELPMFTGATKWYLYTQLSLTLTHTCAFYFFLLLQCLLKFLKMKTCIMYRCVFVNLSLIWLHDFQSNISTTPSIKIFSLLHLVWKLTNLL